MTAYFSRLSPVPGFPSYTGPYKVGTIDVELPVSKIESPSPAPVDDVPTIQYRIFYPCEPDAKGKAINWLPTPQRGYVSAYTRFLGAGSWLAEIISWVQSNWILWLGRETNRVQIFSTSSVLHHDSSY